MERGLLIIGNDFPWQKKKKKLGNFTEGLHVCHLNPKLSDSLVKEERRNEKEIKGGKVKEKIGSIKPFQDLGFLNF